MPWSVAETWLGLLLFVFVIAAILVISAFLPEQGSVRSIFIAVLEAVLVIPVVIILGLKRISWCHLGFRKFNLEGMAVGCGLLAIMYPLVILHNFLLMRYGIDTQGENITELFKALDAPIPFLVAGVLLAPFAEEIFFRGFLFAGLRQRFGWLKAMLISSALFAVFHLQPVAIIPTFLLGCVLTYTFHHSKSIWPGILVHLSINGLALLVTVVLVRMGWV